MNINEALKLLIFLSIIGTVATYVRIFSFYQIEPQGLIFDLCQRMKGGENCKRL
jgi:hypothetical protein